MAQMLRNRVGKKRATIFVIAMLLSGCRYGPDDFARSVRPATDLDLSWSVPEAPDEAGDPLYQRLYQDEYGEAAQAVGQRARMLVWLRWMELNPEQLTSLGTLLVFVAEQRGLDEAQMAALGARESAELVPIYEQLIVALADQTPPDAAALARWSEQLRAAQAKLKAAGDVRAEQRARTKAILLRARRWIAALQPTQMRRVGDARFFLRRRLGPLVNPGHHSWVIGGHWDAGDFDALRYQSDEGQTPHMDIGGLWASEAARAQPVERLRVHQATTTLAMAVSEPGLMAAIEVAQGERSALDALGR